MLYWYRLRKNEAGKSDGKMKIQPESFVQGNIEYISKKFSYGKV